jgi:hypothetical protein
MTETKQGGLELLNHQKEQGVEVHTYTIKDEEGVLVYKEWVQDGQVIDSILEGKHGDTIFDEDLIERVQGFIDAGIQEGTIKP